MPADPLIRQALATRIAQRLTGPAETLLGYQTLIVAEIRETGPADALPDAEQVLAAAAELQRLVASLLSPDAYRGPARLDEATLRHELRTPVNVIKGYSELIEEEWAEALAPRTLSDVRLVLEECGRILAQLDTLVEVSRGDLEAAGEDPVDSAVAAALQRSVADRSPPPKETGGQVLVIDDIAANGALICRQLAARGHDGVAVTSAREALALLETHRFDLALVDILMPDMNGIELLDRLKSDPRWCEMAVVMVSGLKDVQAVVKCIQAGAEDYLHKPVDPVLLNARVESCLAQSRWREKERRYVSQIEAEKSRADGLLKSMLPESIIFRLNRGETVIADRFEMASIVFADIVDFTPLVAETDPSRLLGMLHDTFSHFDALAERHGIEKIKTIGDAYMAVAGVPDPHDDHADRALDFARDLLGQSSVALGPRMQLRVGINSGPVIAGLIGRKRFVYDVWGETVNLAARLEASGTAGRIQVSRGTLEALRNAPPGTRAQMKTLKGIGRLETYLVE